jgi:hypothetical protein
MLTPSFIKRVQRMQRQYGSDTCLDRCSPGEYSRYLSRQAYVDSKLRLLYKRQKEIEYFPVKPISQHVL